MSSSSAGSITISFATGPSYDAAAAHDGAVTVLDCEQLQHVSRAGWAVAVLGALALHAGGAAIALGMRPSDTDDDLGAPAMVIGIELTSPQRDPSNLPVGPDTDASAPAPEVVEQKQVEKQTDLPKAMPMETDDPERVVSPNDSQQPTQGRSDTDDGGSRSFASLSGGGADRDAVGRKRTAVAALGRAVAGDRRERGAPARHLGKGARGAFQQVQALSGGPGRCRARK